MQLTVLLLVLTIIHYSYQQQLCDSTASCGCSQKLKPLAKIAGGNTAKYRYWGWVVSIAANDKPFCGGSILSSSWILSSASCFTQGNVGNITVFAGSNSYKHGTQTRKAATVIPHPNYDASKEMNDIALIRLETPLDMTDPAVAKICLPLHTTENYPAKDSSLVTFGWGAATENESSNTLREISVKAVSDDNPKCQPLIYNSSAQLCAVVDNLHEDTCYGDGGNPLMTYTSSRQWGVVGIVSYGRGCNGEYATVYTRVASYVDWIESMQVTDAIAINIDH